MKAIAIALAGLMGTAPALAQVATPPPEKVEEPMAPAAVAEVQVRQVEHLVGTRAVTLGGQEMGTVETLLVRPDGSVAGLVLEWGGVAGLGERRAAIPWSAATVSSSGRQLMVDLPRERLEAIPPWDPDAPTTSGVDPDVVPLR